MIESTDEGILADMARCVIQEQGDLTMRTTKNYEWQTQVVEAVELGPDAGLLGSHCNVYACDAPAALRINIGGGNSTTCQNLCRCHASYLLGELHAVMGKIGCP